MLSRIGRSRYVVVAVAIAFMPVLVLIGWMGGGHHEEKFDAKQIVVVPVGNGVRIREVVDQDFGSYDRHGYERIIPQDFGEPTDIVAYTFDAPTGLWISDLGFETRIRIGDPNTTITGQHRYELDYTLPDARLDGGELALDIIGTEETLRTDRFEVILAGFDLADPVCNVGSFDAEGGCELERDGDVYRVVLEPLDPGQGVTVGGTITAITDPADVAFPAPIDERSSNRWLGALVIALVGAAVAGAVYLFQGRRGRNLVGGDGPADAAHATEDSSSSRLVTDAALQDMATIEFEPPRDLHPWQGTVLLDEAVSARSVSAWFAEQIARDVLVLSGEAPVRMTKGPRWKEVDIGTMQYVRDIFGEQDELSLGRYHPSLGQAWNRLQAEQTKKVRNAKWWVTGGPGDSSGPKLWASAWYVLGVPLLMVLSIVVWALGWMSSWIVVGILAAALSASVAGIAFAPLRAGRSALGSALALQTESFRRFLASSEGQHVDWAWERGVLREYTAWAVALGAADAWGRAIDASAIPPEVASTIVAPSVFAHQLGKVDSARTPPPPPPSASSGSSGSSSSWSSSSSFSSGSVGGGGGGGSSGSW